MILSANSLSMSFGDHLLFDDLTFSVEAGDKIGIIGPNGCGKTTLFNLILGKIQQDKGGIVRESGLNVGYLQQHACKDSSLSAYNEALSVFAELIKDEQELETLSRRLETESSDELITRYEELNDKFIKNGGLTYKNRTRAALRGLGFSDDEQALSISALSGGQRSKIELCRLLLSEPDLLLLDEPTNHLDTDSVVWLEEFLSSYKGAAMIISHDRYFLDKVTSRTFSIENRRMYIVNGNYTKFREVRSLIKESERREYENTMREVERIEKIIEQQRRWNREKNIKTAESKEKQIERLTKDLKVPDPEPEVINPSFPIKYESGNDCLLVKNLSVSFPERTLFEGVNLDIKRGERIFLVGPNGCGKTTLIKRLISDNSVKYGVGVSIGYFDQHGEGVDHSKTAFSDIQDSYSYLDNTTVRSALASYLFKGDEVFKNIGDMSGGERARVLLCKLGLKKANFLFLDEPTNHLDLPSREALETALKDYKGTLFVISHDRYFINSLATKVLELTPQGILTYVGNYDNYINARAPKLPEIKEEKKVSENKENYIKRKKDASKLRSLKAAARRLESEIEGLESALADAENLIATDEVSSDYEKLTELTTFIEKKGIELESKMNEWATLSEEIAEMEE